MIEFHVLGPFEAADGGAWVALGPPRQKALLAILLVERGTVVSSDRLVDALWEQAPPATAAKIVHGYVSNLRHVLGDGVIATEGRGYRLCQAVTTDVDRFEQLVIDARQALGREEPETAAETLAEALGLWRGPAFADFSGELFAQAEIARLAEARLDALALRIDAELRLGRHCQLIGELQALVRAHPLQEAFAGQLMLALYRSGRQAEALEYYQELRVRLDDELGLEPGPELQALQLAILAHDPALSPPAGAAIPSSEARRGHARWFGLAATGVAALLVALAIVVLQTSSGAPSRAVTGRPNTVVAINTRSDRVAGAVAVGARPGAIAIAAGSLWVANRDDDTVSQVDPRTSVVLRAIPVPGLPSSLAVSDGGVWVARPDAGTSRTWLGGIDPHFDRVDHRIRIPSIVPDATPSIATAGSTLWVAASSGALTRVDTRTDRIVRQVDPGGGPSAIAAQRDGVVWLTDDESNDLIRVSRTGAITHVPVGHDPAAVVVGDGAVWVTDNGDDDVKEIDPLTGSVRAAIPVGRAPLGLALGAGSVWVANSGDGTVSRIDPSTESVVATIRVGDSPQDIAVDGRRAWVTTDVPAVASQTGEAAGGTIRIVSSEDANSLDPALAEDTTAQLVLHATCAKLLDYPDRSGAAASQLVPRVARALPARSDGGRTYTFTIRPGYRFSPPSDAPVTAETFRDTLERVLSPRMKSPYASDYLDIVGARAFHAGRTRHVSGVVVHGDRLVIRLRAPAPDLPARMAAPAMCAVPSDTPIDPQGANLIPSAGPYRVASYAPGQGIVLEPNPNYHQGRPHRAARITVAVDVVAARAIAEVERGAADYAVGLDFDAAQDAALNARYGPGSPAARAGDQRFFSSDGGQLDFLSLNTHRPLFADARLRRAVSDVIDRRALARFGDEFEPVPEHPTDQYIPPRVPGHRDKPVPRPEVARARALARGHAGSTVVLGTCDAYPCLDQAQIIRRDLRRIGLRVRLVTLPVDTLTDLQQGPDSPFDMTWIGWIPDFLDPEAMLNVLIGTNAVIPSLRSPYWRARLAAAARTPGPGRAGAYARLDTGLVDRAAPLIAFGNLWGHDFFSARVGCEDFGPYGVDLAALCIRSPTSTQTSSTAAR